MTRFASLLAFAAGLALFGAGSAMAADKPCCAIAANTGHTHDKIHTCTLYVKCCEVGNRGFWTRTQCTACDTSKPASACCCGPAK